MALAVNKGRNQATDHTITNVAKTARALERGDVVMEGSSIMNKCCLTLPHHNNY